MPPKKKRMIDYADVPETLDDHVFFGLQLDPEQIAFRNAIYNPDIDAVFVDARAGTGKTTIAVATAVLMYHYGLCDGINYIVAANAESRQGYIPGDMFTKNLPYMTGLYQALEIANEYPDKAIKGITPESDKEGYAFVTAETGTFLRGSNIGGHGKKIVIVDEAQNFTVSELRKTLTRICEGSKVIVIGHQLQVDIPQHASGFLPCMKHFHSTGNPRFAFCSMNTCHRSLIAQVADEPWKE